MIIVKTVSSENASEWCSTGDILLTRIYDLRGLYADIYIRPEQIQRKILKVFYS